LTSAHDRGSIDAPMKRRGSLSALAVLSVVALATAAAASAVDPGREKIRFNAADQAAARAAVIRRTDLRPRGGWKGGAVRPDLSPSPTCPNYHPKLSEFVLTGAAGTDWRRLGLEFHSEANVFQTAQMVRREWQLQVQAPAAVPCLRSVFARTLAAAGARLVSFERIPFPRIAPYAAAFRAVVDDKSQGQAARMMFETILVGRGRTEIVLTTSGPYGARTTISEEGLRLARILVGRIRA
jgi:hypothetical protein